MINRDEKFEGQEDGEYHFSDDEASYEVDEGQKPPMTVAAKPSLLARLPSARRMVIGGVVFLILILVIYRMLTPASTTPSTNIVPVAQPAPTVTKLANPTTETPKPNVIPVASPASQQAPAVAQPPVTVPAAMPMPQQAQAPMPQMQAVPQATAAQSTPIPSAAQVAPGQTQQANVVPPPPISAEAPPTAGAGQGQLATLQTENMRLMSQLQMEANQKLAEFSVQNRVLREQIQTLSTRVAAMENQLSQVVNQTLGKPQSANLSANTGPAGSSAAPLPRIPYSVQAIIPGRAWLKSENGETVTVAEGDMLKGYGRVTKIDPYDGVVEIDVGNRSVTLSYGNGG